MASEWTEPPTLATTKKFQEEDDDDVKDEWDASDDESKKPAEPPKPVAKKPVKPKSTIVDNTPDLSGMSEKDREAYLAAQSLKDWVGDLGETSTLGGVLTDINTTEEAAAVGKNIGELLLRKYGAKETIYRDLVLSVVLEASKTMPSKDQRHMSNTLKVVADDSKRKEDVDKKAKEGVKKGAKVKLATKATDNELGDYAEFATGTGARNDIDDDFM